MDLGLRGRSCAVTGASRGIGRETIASLRAMRAAIPAMTERASYVSGAAWSVDGGTVQVII